MCVCFVLFCLASCCVVLLRASLMCFALFCFGLLGFAVHRFALPCLGLHCFVLRRVRCCVVLFSVFGLRLFDLFVLWLAYL